MRSNHNSDGDLVKVWQKQSIKIPIEANNAGYFKAEIEPIMLNDKKGEKVFEIDGKFFT